LEFEKIELVLVKSEGGGGGDVINHKDTKDGEGKDEEK
jgi:hypothetical protein